MKVGLIGLGRMGSGIARRLSKTNHEVIVWGRHKKVYKNARALGAKGTTDFEEFFKLLPSPRIIWLMIPANTVDEIINRILSYLKKGDIVVDGGNSYFKDSIRRAKELKKKNIFFVDIGTSGGLLGEKIGYCMMVGGEKKAYKKIEPLLKALATKNGYDYFGQSGTGHFVKMVHNGIEYGMMQSLAEGFELIKKSKFKIDLKRLVKVWNNGSIIRGYLTEMAERALEKHPDLKDVVPYAEETGEGRWTVETAIENKIPLTTIAHSLFSRFASQSKDKFAIKMIAALREQFGGHPIKKRR